MKKKDIPRFVTFVREEKDKRMADFLEVNYVDNKALDDIELKTAELPRDEILTYVSTTPNSVGIMNELEYRDNEQELKQNTRFIAGPQKFVLFFLLQYYQSEDYRIKKESLLEENLTEPRVLEGFQNTVEPDYIAEKKMIQEKLNRIARMDMDSILEYIHVDQKSRLEKGDSTPFIIAVDYEDSISFKVFTLLSQAYGWNIREYTSKNLIDSPNNYDTNAVYYHFMDFDDARNEFVNEVSRLDCIFYMRDERDWRVKELFVDYFLKNKKSPTILEFKKERNPKNRKIELSHFFSHMIDTSLYYTQNSVGGDDGKDDESLAIRLPTISIRTIIVCNKEVDERIILLLTAICIQNYTYLQQYMFPGCKDGELQTEKVKKINEIENRVNELSLKLLKNIEKRDEYFTEATLLEDSLEELKNKTEEYMKVGRQCQYRIPVNPFPNFDEVAFCFPSQIVHPVAKEYYHNNGLYSRNPRFKYDLQYYVDKVQEYYWG